VTTGVCCPTCATGISPRKDQPCRDCEIEGMTGMQRRIAEFVRDHFSGPSRQEGCVRFIPDKEPGQ